VRLAMSASSGAPRYVRLIFPTPCLRLNFAFKIELHDSLIVDPAVDERSGNKQKKQKKRKKTKKLFDYE
jgi:hypothetical protein